MAGMGDRSGQKNPPTKVGAYAACPGRAIVPGSQEEAAVAPIARPLAAQTSTGTKRFVKYDLVETKRLKKIGQI